MDKEYEITFTADYTEYKEWAKNGNVYWKQKLEDNPEQLVLCEK